MFTVTPSKETGATPAIKSAAFHARVLAARFDPWISIHEPGAVELSVPKPLTPVTVVTAGRAALEAARPLGMDRLAKTRMPAVIDRANVHSDIISLG